MVVSISRLFDWPDTDFDGIERVYAKAFSSSSLCPKTMSAMMAIHFCCFFYLFPSFSFSLWFFVSQFVYFNDSRIQYMLTILLMHCCQHAFVCDNVQFELFSITSASTHSIFSIVHCLSRTLFFFCSLLFFFFFFLNRNCTLILFE